MTTYSSDGQNRAPPGSFKQPVSSEQSPEAKANLMSNSKKLIKAEAKLLTDVAKAAKIKTVTASRPRGGTPAEVVVVDTTKASGKPKGQRKSARRAIKDKTFLPYLQGLIDPDSAEDIRIPDGFPVPTATVKSVQTIDVIANYNATSAADGNGGRFFFHVAPNCGAGVQNGDGYILQQDVYTNMGPNQTLASVNYILATKVAAMVPSDRFIPGYIYDPPGPVAVVDGKRVIKSFDEKKLTTSTISKSEEYKALEAHRTSNIPKSLNNRAAARRGMSVATTYNNYEFFHDPVQKEIAGDYTLGVYENADVGGLASMIRPVAMSVWFECNKNMADNSGNVAAALLPSGSTTGQIIPIDYNTQPPVPPDSYQGWLGYGPLELWENLAEVPGAYQGKMADGTYTYWLPQRLTDLDMKTPSQADQYDYPTIVVAGQYSPSNIGATEPGPATYLVGRLRIVTHYEYVTENQVAARKMGYTVPDVLGKVKACLHGQQTSMANGKHLAWIKKLLGLAAGAVTGFITGGPAGAFAGGATGLELGSAWANA
jgi:hypothetical protein